MNHWMFGALVQLEPFAAVTSAAHTLGCRLKDESEHFQSKGLHREIVDDQVAQSMRPSAGCGSLGDPVLAILQCIAYY